MDQENAEHFWPGPDEKSVVDEMLADGGSEHWNKCNKFILNYLRTFCLRFKDILSSEDINDISQDTMVSIQNNLAFFRFQGPLTVWLKRIARSRTYDVLRRYKREKRNVSFESTSSSEQHETPPIESVSSESVADVEEQCILREKVRKVKKALEDYANQSRHPERNREIVDRAIFQEEAHNKIAESMDMSAANVSQIIGSAKQFVRQTFEQENPPSSS